VPLRLGPEDQLSKKAVDDVPGALVAAVDPQVVLEVHADEPLFLVFLKCDREFQES